MRRDDLRELTKQLNRFPDSWQAHLVIGDETGPTTHLITFLGLATEGQEPPEAILTVGPDTGVVEWTLTEGETELARGDGGPADDWLSIGMVLHGVEDHLRNRIATAGGGEVAARGTLMLIGETIGPCEAGMDVRLVVDRAGAGCLKLARYATDMTATVPLSVAAVEALTSLLEPLER